MKKKVNIIKIPLKKEDKIGTKKFPYKLSDKANKRRNAIDYSIKLNAKNKNISIEKSAIAKKKRLNVLRIYRKNNYPIECRKITFDIKYIDRKYKLKNTTKIC